MTDFCYLLTLFPLHSVVMSVSSEFERMWIEGVVACFKALPQHLPEGPKENYSKIGRM